MKFDPTIALGTMIHLAGVILLIGWVYGRFMARLADIERKQDKLLSHLKLK